LQVLQLAQAAAEQAADRADDVPGRGTCLVA
jgi:hypothetical protein